MPRGKSTKRQQHAALTREHRKHYQDYVEIQGGEFCAICGRPPKEGGRRLAIDHDHATMKVRGLLCGQCNRRLRRYLTARWLRMAASYLDNPPLQAGRAFPAKKEAAQAASPGDNKAALSQPSLSPRTSVAEERDAVGRGNFGV